MSEETRPREQICRFAWRGDAYHVCRLDAGHEGEHICRCGWKHSAGTQEEFPVDLNSSGLIP